MDPNLTSLSFYENWLSNSNNSFCSFFVKILLRKFLASSINCQMMDFLFVGCFHCLHTIICFLFLNDTNCLPLFVFFCIKRALEEKKSDRIEVKNAEKSAMQSFQEKSAILEVYTKVLSYKIIC